MARKTFFSFHYERDAWRAANVRNSGVLSNDDEYGFIDAADWEKIEREGDAAIKRWIQDQLKNTTVTAVLIGAETASREWVRYEIRESWKRGNAIVGVRISGIKDRMAKPTTSASIPWTSQIRGCALRSSTVVQDVRLGSRQRTRPSRRMAGRSGRSARGLDEDKVIEEEREKSVARAAVVTGHR